MQLTNTRLISKCTISSKAHVSPQKALHVTYGPDLGGLNHVDVPNCPTPRGSE